MNKNTKVEVARSFGGKHNIGDYQNRDFFCSLKADTTLDNFDEVSDELYRLCREKVEKEIEDFKNGVRPKEFKKPMSSGAKIVHQSKMGKDLDYIPGYDDGEPPKGAERVVEPEAMLGGDGSTI